MPEKPLTIDNYGRDASVRYAKDQEIYDASIITESRLIPQKTEVTVAKPYVPSEFDQLFSVKKTTSWALFDAPKNFYAHDKSLFSYELIPSLGNYEKLESDSDKIERILGDQEKEHKDHEEEGSEEEEQEKIALTAFFQTLNQFNKILEAINGKRNQYQRG